MTLDELRIEFHDRQEAGLCWEKSEEIFELICIILSENPYTIIPLIDHGAELRGIVEVDLDPELDIEAEYQKQKKLTNNQGH